jgi:putative Holliday junction resolvase
MDTQDNPVRRALGIDFGLRRIGLALGDTQSRLACPYDCLTGLSDADAVARIARVVDEEAINVIICGVPLNEDGSGGPQAKRTRQFADLLRVTVGDVEVLEINEFLTTFEAESLLASGAFTSMQKKRRVDAIAAARILQGYFNSLI